MLWQTLTDNCIFAFLPELEPLFGARVLLDGEEAHTLCSTLFGPSNIAVWKQRYRRLFETWNAVSKLQGFSMFDFLLDYMGPELTRSGMLEKILSFPTVERLLRQGAWEHCYGISDTDLAAALTDDDALTRLYETVSKDCPNYLAFSAFLRQNEALWQDFFALAAQMDCPALHDALDARTEQIEAQRMKLQATLLRKPPLECSQELMGKTFFNRGPYETFYFLPSLLMPGKAMRFFFYSGTPHNRQILFISLREPEQQREKTVEGLRALADPTRYQILMLLAKTGPINGQDLARSLGLAPSTVSHHMTALRERGLVTEEQTRSAKYYGVSRSALKALLSEIAADFEL